MPVFTINLKPSSLAGSGAAQGGTGLTPEQVAKLNKALAEADVVDNATSTDTDKPVSANQVTILNDKLENQEIKTFVYDDTTSKITLTTDDKTFDADVAGLKIVNTDDTLNGNGADVPLSVALSEDHDNELIKGNDDKLFVKKGTIVVDHLEDAGIEDLKNGTIAIVSNDSVAPLTHKAGIYELKAGAWSIARRFKETADTQVVRQDLELLFKDNTTDTTIKLCDLEKVSSTGEVFTGKGTYTINTKPNEEIVVEVSTTGPKNFSYIFLTTERSGNQQITALDGGYVRNSSGYSTMGTDLVGAKQYKVSSEKGVIEFSADKDNDTGTVKVISGSSQFKCKDDTKTIVLDHLEDATVADLKNGTIAIVSNDSVAPLTHKAGIYELKAGVWSVVRRFKETADTQVVRKDLELLFKDNISDTTIKLCDLEEVSSTGKVFVGKGTHTINTKPNEEIVIEISTTGGDNFYYDFRGVEQTVTPLDKSRIYKYSNHTRAMAQSTKKSKFRVSSTTGVIEFLADNNIDTGTVKVISGSSQFKCKEDKKTTSLPVPTDDKKYVIQRDPNDNTKSVLVEDIDTITVERDGKLIRISPDGSEIIIGSVVTTQGTTTPEEAKYSDGTLQLISGSAIVKSNGSPIQVTWATPNGDAVETIPSGGSKTSPAGATGFTVPDSTIYLLSTVTPGEKKISMGEDKFVPETDHAGLFARKQSADGTTSWTPIDIDTDYVALLEEAYNAQPDENK